MFLKNLMYQVHPYVLPLVFTERAVSLKHDLVYKNNRNMHDNIQFKYKV